MAYSLGSLECLPFQDKKDVAYTKIIQGYLRLKQPIR
jgi:hypothetical protein